MEQFPTSQNNAEAIAAELHEKEMQIDVSLSLAQGNALEVDETEALLQRMNSFKVGGIAEDEEQSQKARAQIAQRIVFVQTLPEYTYLLKKTGMSEEHAVDILAHENAHANKAEALNADFGGYGLLVAKNGDRFQYLPFANTFIGNEGETDQEHIEKEIAVANAPEEYGNANSIDDERRIAELKRQQTI